MPKIPARVSEAVRRRIARYPPAAEDPRAKVVRLWGALPIGRDLGVSIWMRPDGSLFALEEAAELESEPMPIVDATRRTVIFHLAGERFPELLELLPGRPASAADCPRCGGTGFVAPPADVEVAPEARDRWPCPECASLGWVSPGEE